MLSLHYNRDHSFLLVNAIKMDQLKGKDSDRKPYPLCLGNISKDFTLENMRIKNRVERKCESFFLLIIKLLILAIL